MSDSVSVFVCTGCEIGDALDMDALGEVASEDFSIRQIHTHPALCSDEGVAQVRAALGEDGKAVLCACSQREKCDVFRFGDHVVTLFSPECGECVHCRQRISNRRLRPRPLRSFRHRSECWRRGESLPQSPRP